MGKSVLDLVRLALPFGRQKRDQLAYFKNYLKKPEYKNLVYQLKLRRLGMYDESTGAPAKFSDIEAYPQVNLVAEDEKLGKFADKINKKVKDGVLLEVFRRFSQNSEENITSLIAPDIVGMDSVKKDICF